MELKQRMQLRLVVMGCAMISFFWIGLIGGEVGAARFCSGQKRKKHLKVLHLMVGDVGFEPTTHCSQSSCATGLR